MLIVSILYNILWKDQTLLCLRMYLLNPGFNPPSLSIFLFKHKICTYMHVQPILFKIIWSKKKLYHFVSSPLYVPQDQIEKKNPFFVLFNIYKTIGDD